MVCRQHATDDVDTSLAAHLAADVSHPKALQLGALKELRQSLMAVADITGKLSKRVEVSFELHESAAFLELRSVMLKVLEKHTEAKMDFLQEMGRLKVVEPRQIEAV